MYLHPELRKTKLANIATKTTAAPADVSEDPYNFMDKTSLSSVGYTTELVSLAWQNYLDLISSTEIELKSN